MPSCLPQRLPARGMPAMYMESNGYALGAELLQRTEEEERRFTYALWEMSRLYAYKDCNVIALPEYATPSDFPAGTGEPLLQHGDL